MILFSRLLNKMGYEKKGSMFPPLLDEVEIAKLNKAASDVIAIAKPTSKGRVIKETKPAEYDPRPRHKGGRIVKSMPKQLQRMKAAQEKVEDDGPAIED